MTVHLKCSPAYTDEGSKRSAKKKPDVFAILVLTGKLTRKEVDEEDKEDVSSRERRIQGGTGTVSPEEVTLPNAWAWGGMAQRKDHESQPALQEAGETVGMNTM